MIKVKTERVMPDPSGNAPPCTTFIFTAYGERMFGRRWDDDKTTADLIHWRDANKTFRRFEEEIPYHHPLFRQAVRHYVDNEGIRNVLILVFPKGQRGRRIPEMKRVDLRRIRKQQQRDRTSKSILSP
jgi:hypothetical protein